MNTALLIPLMILSALIASVGSLFLKIGAHHFHIKFTVRGVVDIIKNWRIILGLFFYVLSTVIFIYILRTEELSLVYPLSSMSYIFITLFSAYYLKEKINFYKVIGISLIVFGVIVTTL